MVLNLAKHCAEKSPADSVPFTCCRVTQLALHLHLCQPYAVGQLAPQFYVIVHV